LIHVLLEQLQYRGSFTLSEVPPGKNEKKTKKVSKKFVGQNAKFVIEK